MKLGLAYFSAALLFGYLVLLTNSPPLMVFLAWTAISLLLVSIAYCFNLAKIFRKKSNGQIPWYIRVFFVPFLLIVHLYNVRERRLDKVPPMQKVDEQLFLACRLVSSDIEMMKEQNIDAVLDVTCEFNGLDWSLQGENFDYLNVPVLDHAVPTKAQLNQAVNWIHRHIANKRNVVVHCALGRGRSVMVVAAYLLCRDAELSPKDVHERIQMGRETARLNARQFRTLKRYRQSGQIAIRQRMAIIANPSSGAKKWLQHKDYIKDRFSDYFEFSVYETTEEKNGSYYAQRAIRDGVDTVVACGGDGTVTEVASALVDSDVVLGIIPFGTANALMHVLCGIASKFMSVESACDIIIEGASVRVDTARSNDRLMLLLTGFGFERTMIEDADRDEKDIFGELAYIRGFLKAVNENRVMSLCISIDDQEPEEMSLSSLVVANAAPFSTLLAQGDGEPDYQDGFLDVTYIKGQNRLPVSFSLIELIAGALTPAKIENLVRHRQARKVKINSSESLKYAIDGELFEDKEVCIEILPKSLNVLVPGAATDEGDN